MLVLSSLQIRSDLWKWKLLSHVWLFATPWTVAPPVSSAHGDSPGKDTGVGCHALFQGIFPTEGSNPGLLHCGQILYQLSHQGSPRILEWVACPFSRGSSWPRNQTRVSWVAGRFFTIWATGEAPVLWIRCYYPSFTNKEAERCNLPEVIKLCQSHDSKPQQSGSRIHALTVRHLLTNCKTSLTSQSMPLLPSSTFTTTFSQTFSYHLWVAVCHSVGRTGQEVFCEIVRRWLVWKI